MVVTNFNYEPRDHIWSIVNKVHEEGQCSQSEALTLIQEYIYCVEGIVYPTRKPATEEEVRLMNYAMSVSYNVFLRHTR